MKNYEKISAAQKLEARDWDLVCARAEGLMLEHKPGKEAAVISSRPPISINNRSLGGAAPRPGFGCSESLMLAFQETLGEDILPPEAVAMAGAFRGGLGGAGCLCGALAAAEMVLGVFFGYYGTASGEQNPDEVKKSRGLYQELHDDFRQAHGATCCRVLTKKLEAGSAERKANCAALTRSAAFIAGGIIAREAAKG